MMKKSASELLLEAFFRSDGDDTVEVPDSMLFGFGNRDNISSLSNDGQLLFGAYQTWPSQNPSPKQSSVSTNLECQSSICDGTPTSSFPNSNSNVRENQAQGGSSGSEQTDEESLETEGGPCEQSKSVVYIKQMRRKVSNRESARRSRRRKQAHLADLELQMDQLRGENQSLFKQLTDANTEFTEAVTNNRILKADVEKLRVQVKMAEDMVARGTLACSLDNILQSHVGQPQLRNSRLPSSDVLPPIQFPGNDASYIGTPPAGQIQNMTMENGQVRNGDMRYRFNHSSPLESIESLDNHETIIHSEVAAWNWDSNASTISK